MDTEGVAAALEVCVLSAGECGIFDESAGLGAGHEQAGGSVTAVGKAFAPDDETLAAKDGQHHGTSEADEHGVAGGEMDATGNGGGDFAIDGGFVVERAVGFDMTELETSFAGGVAGEGDLGGDHINDGGGVVFFAEKRAAAEVFGVRVAGVGAGANLGGGHFAEGGAGEFGRAGMGGATDVGEVEVAEQFALFAGFEEGGGFAEVAIQEHGHSR